ncbi:MAG TPA: S8 family serine peptidase [Verrucomicrobiae bacterium]|nr:S8 family serine peptidase [Verrucomicrobiae bacterium]
MLRTRFTIWCCGLLLALVPSSFAAVDVIKFKGFEVEANSVLAKLKETEPGKIQAFSVPDAQIQDRSRLVSGLLTLAKQPPALQALSVEDKAVALVKWIADLKASGQFEYVEPNYIRRPSLAPNDLRFVDGTLWSLYNYGQNGGIAGADISAQRAWDLTTGSTNVIVGVIDTGIRYTHKDLAAQMWHNPNEIPGNGIDDDNDGFVDDVFGIDAFANDGDPNDDLGPGEIGHGTHVSGTIGAAANDGNPHVGISWNVQLMALRGGDEVNGLPDSATIRCMDFAATHGVKIINASWGGYGFDQALFDAINSLRQKGILFIAAAGNDSNDNDSNPTYPSSFNLDNIISVAATDRRDLIAGFSNFGKTTVHLGAPGVEIFSTYFNSDSDYTFLDGTSMATPHVTGVAALVAAYLPGASYSEIRSRILEGVDPIPSLANKTITGGRLNAYKALTRGIDGIMEFSVTPPTNSFLSTGRAQLFTVGLSDGPPITNATVTLGTPGGTNLTLVFDGSGNSPTAGAYTNTYQVSDFPGSIVLKLNASAPGKTNLAVQLPYQVVNRPSNDNFADALKIPQQQSFIHVTSNRLATIEGQAEQRLNHGGVTNASASIWYAWTVKQATPVIVDTAGSTFDTVIGVYQGTALTNLEQVAAANDVGSRKQAWVKFVAQPGVSYKIAIAGVPPDDQGTVRVRFELNGEPDTVAPILQVNSPVSGLTIRSNKVTLSGIAFDPEPNASGIQPSGIQYTVSTNSLPNPSELPVSANGTTNWTALVTLDPGINFVTIWALDNAQNKSIEQIVTVIFQQPLNANDLFFDRITITTNETTRTDSNVTASKEFGEPVHAGNPGGKSLWYQFIAPTSGVLLVSTRGSSFDTLLGVYTSTNATPRVTTLQEVASNDDVLGGGSYSEVTVTVDAGQTYYIAVDGYDAASGTVQLTWAFNPVPVFHLTILPSLGGGTVTPRSGPFPANATVSVFAHPDAGSQFQYFETASGNVAANPLTVVMTSDVTVRAVFSNRAFAETFEGGFHLPFVVTNWSITADPANGLNHVLLSPGNGLNRVTNTASVTVRLVDGIGSFDFGVSTETNYDKLEFYVTQFIPGQPTNTVLLGSWSGEQRGRYQFAVSAGTIRLDWRYTKDIAITQGRDQVLIDNLDLPLATGQAALAVKNQTLTLNVADLAGQSLFIESSTDLKTWSPVGTFTADANGKVAVSEPAGAQLRFFRFTPRSAATP